MHDRDTDRRSDSETDELERLAEIEWHGNSDILVPPHAVMEFARCARKPNVAIGELSTVVEVEPELTAELLRHVNSSLYGFRQQVHSISQAISLLGISHCVSLFLTSALDRALQDVDSPLLPHLDFRRETLERALFAKEAAARLGLEPLMSYTAATLQDILLPMLTSYHHDAYQSFLTDDSYLGIDEFERDAFGWTHSEVTAHTLLKWEFPRPLIIRVLHHHRSPEEMLVADGPLHDATPNAIAALLSDVLNQSPSGVTRLVDLSKLHDRLKVLEIANVVDESIGKISTVTKSTLPLVKRIQFEMMNQIERRRKQSVVPGRQFGSYVLEEEITESTCGAIFRGRHIMMRRPAAIKILRADRMDRGTIEQFEKEVQLTSQLCHPNTISIFDYGHTPDGHFYYAMELMNGFTLADLIEHEGTLPDGRVASILNQICGSLAEAHARGLVHRDIKPQNIMLSDSVSFADRVTVLDFGLVMDRQDLSEKKTGIVGTPLFISPEAARGQQTIDARSDLYSVGAVAYFLLTGLPVFEGNCVLDVLMHHANTAPIPVSDRTTNPLAPEFEETILRCLCKDPADRPPSAAELAEQLSRCRLYQAWTARDAEQWWKNYREHGWSHIKHDVKPLTKTIIQTES